MLVLSRKVDEKIMIGDEIVIQVVRINRDEIRLGIEAPRSLRIDREEVYLLNKAREADKSLAAGSPAP